MYSSRKNIVIVAHKFLTQPDDDLVSYLNDKKYNNVMHIRHSFSDAPDRCSYHTWFKSGEIAKEGRTRDYRDANEVFIHLKEFYFTLKWIWNSRLTWDTYIGMDGLCVFWGNILRALSKVRRTIYWAIDFVPEKRFGSRIKNTIYHWINKQGYSKSDEMWDLSPRMAEARETFLGVQMDHYRFHKVVPYGVWTERIRKYRFEECEKHSLVFMGHLIEKQGVQLVIQALPEILAKMPDFRFKIIGDGSFRKDLVKLAENLQVGNHCDFKCKIDDHKDLENEIAKSCVAIAPYVKKLDTWTYYADPGKVKTYLACGVPVLLTDLPWNAREIEAHQCGKIMSEDKHDIVLHLVTLMDGKVNQIYRNNAERYAQSFNFKTIFANLAI